MVREDLNRSGGPKKVVAPGVQGSHDSEQFLIIYVIVAFSRAERLRQVSARAPFVIDVFLQENSARCVFGGIRGDCKRGREVGEVKDWLGSKRGFQGSEGIIARAVPGPGMGFLGEVQKRTSGVRVVQYKASVEICESKEGSDVFDCRGGRPIRDSGYFDWIHGQGSRFDYHSQVFDLSNVEGTFLQLEIKIKFLHSLKNSLCPFFMVSVIV